MPAPSDAAMPTRKAFHELCVANAAANTGAKVETEPSISPTRPGCTICSTKRRFALVTSSVRPSVGGVLSSISSAVASCAASATARSPNRLRIEASEVLLAAWW